MWTIINSMIWFFTNITMVNKRRFWLKSKTSVTTFLGLVVVSLVILKPCLSQVISFPPICCLGCQDSSGISHSHALVLTMFANHITLLISGRFINCYLQNAFDFLVYFLFDDLKCHMYTCSLICTFWQCLQKVVSSSLNTQLGDFA